MTRERDGWLSTAATVVARVVQLALAGVAVYGIVRGQYGLLVNAGLPLLVALVPTAIERRYGDTIHPVLELWIVAAAGLHTLGILGPYRTYPWYDQVAHAVSASMIAGVGYALVRAIEENHDDVVVPGDLRFVFVVTFGVSFGVVWEVAEFALGRLARGSGGEPILVQYGLDDVIMDQAANTVGATLVALWGTRYFDGLRSVFERATDDDADEDVTGQYGSRSSER